ncbi:MAG: Ig-like domain repeat protein [Acidimicrobiales bacterium]
MRTVGVTSVVALVVAALTFAVSGLVVRHPSTPKFELTSGTGFMITSTISSSSTSQIAALLAPGIQRYLWYNVDNPLTVPITVTSMSISAVTPPSGCATSNLDYSETTYSPTQPPPLAAPVGLVVPGKVGLVDGTNAMSVPISLYETHTNQSNTASTTENCAGQTFNFTYTGTASYTDSTTTSLTSAPNPSTSGTSVTFTATVTASNASVDPSGLTGSVNFYSCTSSTGGCTTLLGSGTVASNGQTTYSTSSLPTGTTYVEAVYQGTSTNFSVSTSNIVTQVVTSSLVSTKTVLSSTPNPSVFGGSVTFTATVSATSGSSTPTGTVNFYSCPTVACSSTTLLGSGTLSSGKATYSTSSLPVGTTYVEAIYQGVSGSFNASTSNIVKQVVGSVSTTTALTSSPNPSVVGQSVTFTATVSPTSGSSTPTGTVKFYSCPTAACSSTTLLGSGTLSSGKATYSTTALPLGDTYVEAVYQGVSGTFGGSTSNIVTQVVTLISTTTALTSSSNPSVVGQSVTFRATVSPTSGSSVPSGTVKFYKCASATSCSSPTLLGSGTLSSGKATYSTSSLALGNTYVEAVYQGVSGTFATSTSNIVTQVVTLISTTTALTSSPNPSVVSQSVTFTATVSATSGSATPTGTVNFYKCSSATGGCSTLLGSGTLGSGKATYSTSTLPAGNTYVEAVYQGLSGTFATSTSNIVTQVVTSPIATTTALTSSPNPSLLGESVTLSATVTKSSGSGTPSGTVSFYLGTPSGTHSLLGTGTLNSSGKASLTTTSLPAGTDSLYAVYGGGGSFAASTSPVITQVVIAPPSICTGSFSNFIIGNPGFPIILGTPGNSFIYAFGGDFLVIGGNGNDCIWAGNGDNLLIDGNSNDAVMAGNGDNTVGLGNGNDEVFVGNGSNGIEAGNGTDSVTVGNGSHNSITVGNGTDTVTIGTGSYNTVTLGSGTDTVTIQSPGSNDTITGGSGNETIYLGSGTYNTYNGAAHRTNTCHLPKPPSSWKGTTAAYYHDTVTNCTVVSP